MGKTLTRIKKEVAFNLYDHTRPPHIPATDIYRLLNFVLAACQNRGGGTLSRQSPGAIFLTTATEEEGCVNVKGEHREN